VARVVQLWLGFVQSGDSFIFTLSDFGQVEEATCCALLDERRQDFGEIHGTIPRRHRAVEP
jgi:hypothetical protein